MDSSPSSTAKPTAVALKLFVTEYSTWMSSGAYGAHQPSATTLPWRRSIML
jgi:hypothetical protein